MMRNQGSRTLPAAPTGQPTGAALLPMRNNKEPRSLGPINRDSTPAREEKRGEERTNQREEKKKKTQRNKKRTEKGEKEPNQKEPLVNPNWEGWKAWNGGGNLKNKPGG